RPDELDRVFRIRDGYHTPEKTSEQNHETNDEEIINNISVKEAEQIRGKKEEIEPTSLSVEETKEKPIQQKPEWKQKEESKEQKHETKDEENINNKSVKEGEQIRGKKVAIEPTSLSVEETKEKPIQQEPEWKPKAESYIPKSASENVTISSNVEKERPALSDV